MSWANLDDGFADHPKVIDLPDAAFRLHVCAMCWCSRRLTDGLVRSRELRILGAMLEGCPDDRRLHELAQNLVDARLWDPCEEGWRLHDWLKHNESAKKVAERREAAKQRMAEHRKVKSGEARTFAALFARTSCERSDERAGEVRVPSPLLSSPLTNPMDQLPPLPPASGGPSACPDSPTTGKLATQGPPPIPDQPAEPSLPGMPSEPAKAPRKRSKPGQDAAERDRCILVATTLLNELSCAIQAVRPSAHRIRVLPATLKHLTDRLMDGATVEEVRHVIAVYQADARRNPDTLVYFNHTTPFRPDNFERAKVRTVEDARKPRYQAPPQVRFGPPPPEEVERINRERRESDDLQAEGTRKAIEERRRIAARPGNDEERAAIAQMVKATEEDHGSQ